MKKVLALVLALIMVLAIVACGQKPAETEKPAETKTEEKKDYSGYTIRIYSNSNSAERVTWLVEKAKEAGFTISLDTNEVYSGDHPGRQREQRRRSDLRSERDPLGPAGQRSV